MPVRSGLSQGGGCSEDARAGQLLPLRRPFVALSLSLELIVPLGSEPECNLISGGYIFRQFTESGFLLLNILGSFVSRHLESRCEKSQCPQVTLRVILP